MTCDEVHDLLPAYALRMLEPSEHEAIEAHLRDCRQHDADLLDLRATSFALDFLAEDTEAAPAPGEAIRLLPPRVDAPKPVHAKRRAIPLRWLAAAAVIGLLFVFGAGWSAHSLTSDGTTSGAPGPTQFAYQLQGADGALVRFSGVEGADHVRVTMANLTRLTDGRLYRLWAVRDGQWHLIGQCNTNAAGGWDGNFAFSLGSGERLVMTVEVPGADPQAHGTPVLGSAS